MLPLWADDQDLHYTVLPLVPLLFHTSSFKVQYGEKMEQTTELQLFCTFVFDQHNWMQAFEWESWKAELMCFSLKYSLSVICLIKKMWSAFTNSVQICGVDVGSLLCVCVCVCTSILMFWVYS